MGRFNEREHAINLEHSASFQGGEELGRLTIKTPDFGDTLVPAIEIAATSITPTLQSHPRLEDWPVSDLNENAKLAQLTENSNECYCENCGPDSSCRLTDPDGLPFHILESLEDETPLEDEPPHVEPLTLVKPHQRMNDELHPTLT